MGQPELQYFGGRTAAVLEILGNFRVFVFYGQPSALCFRVFVFQVWAQVLCFRVFVFHFTPSLKTLHEGERV